VESKIIEAKVRSEFGAMSFPELNIALRALDQILMDRVAADPEAVHREQMAWDLVQEQALRAAG
jgi:hypothetical protein